MPIEVKSLKESNEFLNILLDNITSAVFLIDQRMRIHSFNNAFQTLFNTPEDRLLQTEELFGNVFGCTYAVHENAVCGTTAHCKKCLLRKFAVRAFVEKTPAYREKLTREFFIDGRPILKHFQFSTKYISYDGQEMVMVIIDDITQTETQRIELDQDLQAAAEIQRMLLPASLPAVELIDVAWQFRPCRRIGGDIFNVLRLDSDHWAIYMIDVSGHGVPSAMIAVSVSQTLQPHSGTLVGKTDDFQCIADIKSPAAVLEILDREYPLERFNNFFTISYLVLNIRTGALRYASAGHPLPILIRAAGGAGEFLERGGAVIGMDGLIPFTEHEVRLDPGDKLFLYTDGITEYQDPDGAIYGSRRFRDTLLALRHQSVAAMVEEATRAVLEFGRGAEPLDDFTLLGIEFRGNRGPNRD